MNTYTVSVEVRESGAIGTFAYHKYTVQAADPYAAVKAAAEAAWAEGYETRGFLTPRLTETTE